MKSIGRAFYWSNCIGQRYNYETDEFEDFSFEVLGNYSQIPHRRQHISRIMRQILIARQVVHVAGAAQQRFEIDPGQSRRQMSDDTGLAGPSADRFGHFEHSQPLG